MKPACKLSCFIDFILEVSLSFYSNVLLHNLVAYWLWNCQLQKNYYANLSPINNVMNIKVMSCSAIIVCFFQIAINTCENVGIFVRRVTETILQEPVATEGSDLKP